MVVPAILDILWKLRAWMHDAQHAVLISNAAKDQYEELRLRAQQSPLSQAASEFGMEDAGQRASATIAEDALCWIQKWLRRCPRWPGGHYWYASICLSQKRDVAAAYASCQALIKLEGSSMRANFLLARIYNSSGQTENAIKVLESIEDKTPPVVEELVAALIAEGKLDRAESVLARSNSELDSGSLRVAREYIEFRKKSGTSSH